MAIRYYAEFLTVPLAALMLWLFGTSSWPLAINELVSGWLLWVAVEWWMHAVLFHRVYRRQHWVHHLRPFDPKGSPNTVHTHLALGVLALALVGLVGACLASGFLLGYGTYIYCHHLIHNGTIGPDNSIARRHHLHHRGVERNFNVLCPLGDLVMGTYVLPPASDGSHKR